jgi:hypothetical protein
MNQHTGRGETQEFASEFKGEFRYKTGLSAKLDFEQVNEVTWKLTNGEMTQVPACHGFWGGYRVTKAIAWIMDVGVSKPAWLVRYRDQCCGPMPLKEAKVAALAMAKGAVGDYRISKPVDHLNDLAARLLEAESKLRGITVYRSALQGSGEGFCSDGVAIRNPGGIFEQSPRIVLGSACIGIGKSQLASSHR